MNENPDRPSKHIDLCPNVPNEYQRQQRRSTKLPYIIVRYCNIL